MISFALPLPHGLWYDGDSNGIWKWANNVYDYDGAAAARHWVVGVIGH